MHLLRKVDGLDGTEQAVMIADEATWMASKFLAALEAPQITRRSAPLLERWNRDPGCQGNHGLSLTVSHPLAHLSPELEKGICFGLTYNNVLQLRP